MLSVPSPLDAQNASTAVTVEVRRKPDQPVQLMPARMVGHLPGFAPETASLPRSRFGGDLQRPGEATGYFRVAKEGARWWLVDPEGYRYLSAGVVSVRSASRGSPTMLRSIEENFGGVASWAESTAALLRDHGFNSLGSWSETDALRQVDQPLPYTLMLNLMAGYGQRRGGTYQRPGHTGYPEGVFFAFDPEFPAFCRERVARLASLQDDPYLLGTFSDNELPFPEEALDSYLKLPPNEPGYQGALAWRLERHGVQEAALLPAISADESDAFIRHITDRYFRIVSAAIKEVLPNHLYLGSRFHGRAAFNQSIWEAAGPYIDVVSVNIYWQWTPSLERLRNLTEWSGRPFMVTEWYAKGMDTGLPNVSGAGWVVPTQADRGRFYQHFALNLLEAGNCVGWHWFRYLDNDPEDKTVDPSNRDSNKGIVTIQHQPYPELLEAMKELNDQLYPLTDYFDRRPIKELADASP
jgi:hypothetical protein